MSRCVGFLSLDLRQDLAEVVGRDVLESSHAELTYSILKKIQPSVSAGTISEYLQKIEARVFTVLVE